MDLQNLGTAQENFNNGGATASAQASVNNLGRAATTFSTPVPAPNQEITKISLGGNQGFMDTLFNKLGSFGSEAAHLVGGAVKWLGKTTFNMGKGVVMAPIDGLRLLDDWHLSNNFSAQTTLQNQRLQSLNNDYRSGKIDTQQYKDGLSSLIHDQNQLSKDLTGFNLKLKNDSSQSTKDFINAGAAVLTVMTGGLTEGLDVGLTSAKAAADYLSSVGARAMLSPVEDVAARAALDKGFFEALNPAIQNAVKDSIYKVFVNSTDSLTATQTARAVAANVALKYPLGYAAISSTAQQTYKDLQQKKYGAAIANLAFNATLLLSGGPIGWGMKQAGQGLKNVSIAAGLRPGSLIDELSSYVNNGDRTALGKIAAQKVAAGQVDEVKAVIVGLESNLKRAGGIPGQAIYNIVDHLENYVGWGSLKNMTHEQFWTDFTNYWKNSEKYDAAKKAGLIAGVAKNDPRPIVPLRWSTADKNTIADLSDKYGKKGYESYIQQFPNTAAANNINLQKQLGDIFKISDATERRKAIMSIKTSVAMEGLPKDLAASSAKEGYVPGIYPGHNLPVVPFEQTTGKLATRAVEENEFFVRAGAPVPVLSSIGTLLTRMGMSPEASVTRTYDMFNRQFVGRLDGEVLDTYAAKIADTKAAKAAATTVSDISKAKDAWAATGLSSEDIAYAKKFHYTPEEAVRKFGGGEGQIVQRSATSAELKAPPTASKEPTNTGDYMLKRIRNYMNKPTRGGIQFGEQRVRAPITDMRQLTKKDIQAALSIDGKQLDSASAQKVMEAIMQAHADMPFAVSGLGNKAMDMAYKLPAYKAYMRLQGAGRFTWNPAFRHLRLPFKSTFLSQAEGGGIFPTIPGLNWAEKLVFTGHYQEFDGIINALRKGKLLPGGLGGEAADISGTDLMVKYGGNYPKEALYPVASLVRTMAKRNGMDAEHYIQQFPQEVSDMAQTILAYDRRSSFLNSPLVRTLNIAFFPARFNIKVSTIMAKFLAKQDPLIQFATIKGLMSAPDFFQSPQGQAWYSQYSDIIGFLKYVSPVETLSSVAQALNGISKADYKEMIGGFGELGGLPFGWIPAMLEAQGIINFSVPYVNPKSGVIAQDYIPITVRGRLSAAIQDLMQSMFSYPGSTVGLPSKTKVTSNVSNALTKANTTKDFQSQTPKLMPEQQSFQNVVQQRAGNKIDQGQVAPPASSLNLPQLGGYTATPRAVKPRTPPTYNSQLKRNKVSTAFAGQPPLE